MPSLHDLFDAATDDLPPLPDLAPGARRIAHRRKLATRSAGAALSSALVIGAGTFVLSAQHAGGVANSASGVPRTFSNQYVLDTLRSLWPISGQHLALDPTYGQAIIISEGGQTVGRMFFEVNPDSAAYPGVLNCMYGDPGTSCVGATAADGDRVQAEYAVTLPDAAAALSRRLAVTTPANTTATDVTTAAATSTATEVYGTNVADLSDTARAYRLHGTSLGQLTVMTEKGTLPTDQQLLALVESSAYEELIESAAAAGSFEWLGTPPATATVTPTAAQSTPPTPSASTSVTTPRGSDSAQPPANR